MSVDLTTPAAILNQLKRRQAYLAEHYGVTRIGVFGSVARGEATNELLTAQSEIDWESVIFTRDLPRFKQALIQLRQDVFN
ncbi:hypothetical protein XM38_046980 [Halomicronema hongdechloris C2206]|uniref:Polymerase beta nucleotidyltransferase domain-containing protein n=1 Tax=Halomicronema hongdechloris C2206 TaxID=1641165 RepID=A0A1Z3HTY4_9CYAN|nr:hypothetical protein [Halomicronema hongdechloris]ASC73726.1 hypothetical protein XM38_046980 [Halomicronema hongdechloris C2206]